MFSETVSSLIASFGFILIIDDFVLFISYNFIQIFDPNCGNVFRVLELLGMHRLKHQFCQLFVKGFHKGCVSVLVFCCYSRNINVVFFKQLCHSTFKFRPIITLKHPWVIKHTTLFIDCFQYKCNLICFLGPKSPSNLVS